MHLIRITFIFFTTFFSWRIRSNISTTIWYPIQFAVDSLDRRQEDNKNLKKCRFFPFVLDKSYLMEDISLWPFSLNFILNFETWLEILVLAGSAWQISWRIRLVSQIYKRRRHQESLSSLHDDSRFSWVLSIPALLIACDWTFFNAIY